MKFHLYCMAFFAMMLYACNKSPADQVQGMQIPSDQTTTENKEEEGQNKNKQLNAADTVIGEGSNNPPAVRNNNNPDWDKKIIKTADLQLQLDDYKKFNASIHNSVEQFGAFIAEEKQQESDFKIENSITIKVPVDQFDNLV